MKNTKLGTLFLFLIAAGLAAAQTTNYTIPAGFQVFNIEGSYYPEQPVDGTMGYLVTGTQALYFEWLTGGNNNGTEPWAEYCAPQWVKTLRPDLRSTAYEFTSTCQANAQQSKPGSPSATIAIDIVAYSYVATEQCGRYICHPTKWVVISGGATITMQ